MIENRSEIARQITYKGEKCKFKACFCYVPLLLFSSLHWLHFKWTLKFTHSNFVFIPFRRRWLPRFKGTV